MWRPKCSAPRCARRRIRHCTSLRASLGFRSEMLCKSKVHKNIVTMKCNIHHITPGTYMFPTVRQHGSRKSDSLEVAQTASPNGRLKPLTKSMMCHVFRGVTLLNDHKRKMPSLNHRQSNNTFASKPRFCGAPRTGSAIGLLAICIVTR